jgi:hypothetical protein
MTAKHNSKHARNALWVAKHRAATAKSDPKKQDHDARQHVLMAKTKASRGMSALLASLDSAPKDKTEKDSNEKNSDEKDGDKKTADASPPPAASAGSRDPVA